MFKGTLKPYQVEAVTKMVQEQKILVAFEMGLGKTPMTIAAIEDFRDRGKINKTVLVPYYRQQYDTTAERILKSALPGYKIIGIDCDNFKLTI
jgi:superfamily II DNA or RNA helicase